MKRLLLICLMFSLLPNAYAALGNSVDSAKQSYDKAMSDLVNHVAWYKYDDPRKVVTVIKDNRTGEFSGVGRLVLGNGSICSGFALAHPRVVATAAHCFFKSNSNGDYVKLNTNTHVTFQPGFFRNDAQQSISGKLVRVGSPDYASNPDRDYAVILLDGPIQGRVIQPDLNNSFPSDNMVAASYSNDSNSQAQSMTLVAGCHAEQVVPNSSITHHCSHLPGGSGGLLGSSKLKRDAAGNLKSGDDVRAVGILTRESDGADGKSQIDVIPNGFKNANYAVPIENVMPAVNAVIAKIR